MATFTATTCPMMITSVATVVSSRPFLAKEILWYATGTGAASAIIADLNGNIIAEGIANATLGNAIVTMWAAGGTRLTLKGTPATPTGSWQVSTLTNGTIAVYF